MAICEPSGACARMRKAWGRTWTCLKPDCSSDCRIFCCVSAVIFEGDDWFHTEELFVLASPCFPALIVEFWVQAADGLLIFPCVPGLVVEFWSEAADGVFILTLPCV